MQDAFVGEINNPPCNLLPFKLPYHFEDTEFIEVPKPAGFNLHNNGSQKWIIATSTDAIKTSQNRDTNSATTTEKIIFDKFMRCKNAKKE